MLLSTPTTSRYIAGASAGTRSLNCQLSGLSSGIELSKPTTVKNVLIVFVKVRQLNEVGETRIPGTYLCDYRFWVRGRCLSSCASLLTLTRFPYPSLMWFTVVIGQVSKLHSLIVGDSIGWQLVTVWQSICILTRLPNSPWGFFVDSWHL